MPVPRDAFLKALPDEIASIFDQAQFSSINHAKNCATLHKLHLEASKITRSRDGGQQLIGENRFSAAFLRSVYRILPHPKGNRSTANEGVQFIGSYTKFVNHRAEEEHRYFVESEGADPDEETYANRFTAKISTTLRRGFDAGDKNIRYRSMQALAAMVRVMGTIQEDLYDDLRFGLLERMNDKDINVRAMAANSIAFLCREDTPVDVQDALLESLSTDSSADVRRAVLQSIMINPITIPHIVARGRDSDDGVRRVLYKSVLKEGVLIKKAKNKNEGEEIEVEKEEVDRTGPWHPRKLSTQILITIVSNGLQDRESSVKRAAATVINEWVKAFEAESVKIEGDGEVESVESGIISLLECFGVVKRSAEQLQAVECMLHSIFDSRKDISAELELDEGFWKVLGPENALLTRVFVEYCQKNKDEARLESFLPVVTNMEVGIREHYHAIAEAHYHDIKLDNPRERLFIFGELLKVATLLDYKDQYGRERMLPTIKALLLHNILPETLLSPCLDVLQSVSLNECQFVRMVVEIIQNLQESVAEEADNGMELDARRLKIFIHLLTSIELNIEAHPILTRVFKTLVYPCVKVPDTRQDALRCIGLGGLIDGARAPEAMQRCVALIASPPKEGLDSETLVVLFETVFDLILKYEDDIFQKPAEGPWRSKEEVQVLLIKPIGEFHDMPVYVCVCTGLAKLLLDGLLDDDPTAIINLLATYFFPESQDSQQLIQCLTYFFKVFSYMSRKNAEVMRKIFMDVFKCVAKERRNRAKKRARERAGRNDDEGDDEYETITSANLCTAYQQWVSPETMAKIQKDPANINHSIQLEMAHDILKELFERDPDFKLEKEDKRALTQFLTKLHQPETVDEITLANIVLLVEKLQKCHPPTDGPSRKALEKFQKTITEKYAKQLEGLSEDDYRKWDKLHNLFTFLDDIFTDDEDSKSGILEAAPRGTKRRSRSSATSVTTDNEGRSARAKRPRHSKSSAGSDEDDEDDDGTRASRRGTRRRSTAKAESVEPVIPKRKVKRHPADRPIEIEPEVIVISSDSDEEPAPAVRPRARCRSSVSSSAVKLEEPDEEREEDIDAEISHLLRSQSLSVANITQDSLFSDDESYSEANDSEEEVSGLLAGE